MVKEYRHEENGKTYHFPDDATNEEIEEFVSSHSMSQKDKIRQSLPEFNERFGGGSPLTTLKNIAAAGGHIGNNIGKLLSGGRMPDFPINEMVGLKKGQESPFLQGAIEALPYIVGGGASLTGQSLAGGVQGLTHDEPGLLSKGLKWAGGPDTTDSPWANRGLNAIEGMIPAPLLQGAIKGLNALRPSRFLRGNLPESELRANLEAARGPEIPPSEPPPPPPGPGGPRPSEPERDLWTQGPPPEKQYENTYTGLGDVIGNPTLKRTLENTLPKVPLSGGYDKLQKAGQAVEQKMRGILSNFLGKGDPTDIPLQLNTALTKALEARTAEKNALYNTSNQMADSLGMTVQPTRLSAQSRRYIESLENNEILNAHPEEKALLKRLQIYDKPTSQSTILGENGKPIKKPLQISLQEANLLKGKFNKYADQYAVNPDPDKQALETVFTNLANSIRDDIQGSLKSFGNKELTAANEAAEKNYQDNFSPFLDKELFKYAKGKKDPETIVQAFLKSGRSRATDRAGKLGTLSEKLPPAHKDLLSYSYFSRALDNEGRLNHQKFASLKGDLGPNQFKKLVPDAAKRKEISDAVRLYGMNDRGINVMKNMQNGQVNSDVMAMITAVGQAIAGGSAGGPLGAIGAVAIPAITGRTLVNTLTSSKVRENMVKAMLEGKDWKIPLQALHTTQKGITNKEKRK